MTDTVTGTSRVLVHATDPGRVVRDHDGVTVLPRVATLAALALQFDDASLLVVDDALAFPFEALRRGDRDIPLLVRLPAGLDADGMEQVLGRDVIDHLTPFDQVVGPRAATERILARRRLPASAFLGGPDVDLDDLLTRGLRGVRRIEAGWRPAGEGRPALLNALPPTVPGEPLEARLRPLKSRMRTELVALRWALAGVESRQPPNRELRVAVAARWPTAWLSALPRRIESWTGLALAPVPTTAHGMPRDPGTILEVPASGRLPLDAGSFDVVLLAGQILHAPQHAVARVLEELVRLIRPGGWVVVLADVVVDLSSDGEQRVEPLSTTAFLDLAGEASGRQLLLSDVRALRRPGARHHRAGLFVFQCMRTAKEHSWT